MLGAIAGDIIGSVYEWNNTKSIDFPLFSVKSRFTDDTALSIAIADCILHQKEYAVTLRTWGRKYPLAGYGGNFKRWLSGVITGPYNSWGNGSAMRVSSVGFAMDSLETTLEEAKRSAEVTHNHPEGIKGAQATAAAIFLARTDHSKMQIKQYIQTHFQYDLERTIAEIRPDYTFDVSCQGSVPEAIIAFLESTDYESSIRLAISLGGDSDTIACITGGIAEAFYGIVPVEIATETRKRLPEEMRNIVDAFYGTHMQERV